MQGITSPVQGRMQVTREELELLILAAISVEETVEITPHSDVSDHLFKVARQAVSEVTDEQFQALLAGLYRSRDIRIKAVNNAGDDLLIYGIDGLTSSGRRRVDRA